MSASVSAALIEGVKRTMMGKQGIDNDPLYRTAMKYLEGDISTAHSDMAHLLQEVGRAPQSTEASAKIILGLNPNKPADDPDVANAIKTLKALGMNMLQIASEWCYPGSMAARKMLATRVFYNMNQLGAIAYRRNNAKRKELKEQIKAIGKAKDMLTERVIETEAEAKPEPAKMKTEPEQKASPYSVGLATHGELVKLSETTGINIRIVHSVCLGLGIALFKQHQSTPVDWQAIAMELLKSRG